MNIKLGHYHPASHQYWGHRTVGHPKAKRAYAWSHKAGKDDSDERFVAALEIPPIVSPETAVRAAIVAETKGNK